MSAQSGQPKKKKKMSGCMLAGIIGCGVLVLATPIVLIIGSIAVPNLLNAIDRGKQKRTMADLRSIGAAVEIYSIDHEFYPAATSIEELHELLTPIYAADLSFIDGWERPYSVVSRPEGYVLMSAGKDGLFDDCSEGATRRFDADICFEDGQFTQWPEGNQR